MPLYPPLVVLQNAAAANGAGAEIDCGGIEYVAVYVSGTYDARLNHEGLLDGQWFALSVRNVGEVRQPQAVAFVASVGGMEKYRVRISDYVKGQITVKARLSSMLPVVEKSGVLLDDSGLLREVQRTPKDLTLAADEELVPAQGAGIKIRVLAFHARAGLAVSLRLKSAGNNLSASYAIAANGEMTLPYLPHGWYETSANEALNANQSLAVATGVQVVWIQSK